MAQFLHLFETENEFKPVYKGDDYKEPWVSYTVQAETVNYNKSEEEKLLSTPFMIEALESGNIAWALNNKTIEYSKNEGEWLTMDSGTSISVEQGDTVRFKGTNASYCANTISSTAQFNVKGNIMSLIYGNDFIEEKSLGQYVFQRLFKGCTTVISAENLKLPATSFATRCYDSMFFGCTGLIAAPELPSLNLSSSCYENMFNGCTNLTSAPELPATALANYCYGGMFSGCTSLATAPSLPATTLVTGCYSNMFRGCTSLVAAPELLALNLVGNCYTGMFHSCSSLNYIKAMFLTTPDSNYTNWWVAGVSSSGTFVKNKDATWTLSGPIGIPTGWTIQYAD